ncbi:MAG: Flp pilus assembly protein CpaB [Gaiellales bacterium]
MSIDYRIRNIVIAAVLAAAAGLLTIVYVTSSRSDEKASKESVRVYVPSRDFAIGTSGAKITGAMTAQVVKRDQLVPEAVTSPAQIRGLYLVQPVVKGEQLTLRRFAKAKEQGIRAALTGKQRAVQISGDTNQVLSGTLVPGDRVDVVANLKNPQNNSDVRAVVVLRNLRVLQTEGGDAGASIDKPESTGTHAVLLAMADEQAQRMLFTMKNGDWSLQLRPVKKPADSASSVATFGTVVAGKAK